LLAKWIKTLPIQELFHGQLNAKTWKKRENGRNFGFFVS